METFAIHMYAFREKWLIPRTVKFAAKYSPYVCMEPTEAVGWLDRDALVAVITARMQAGVEVVPKFSFSAPRPAVGAQFGVKSWRQLERTAHCFLLEKSQESIKIRHCLPGSKGEFQPGFVEFPVGQYDQIVEYLILAAKSDE
jgi:hypothetical protein